MRFYILSTLVSCNTASHYQVLLSRSRRGKRKFKLGVFEANEDAYELFLIIIIQLLLGTFNLK